ncbi:MAG: DUF4333 domain-containing protein [Mycobacterium sp.]|nr:DUF4333 domain-containing protein [Mycobacterium sp.]
MRTLAIAVAAAAATGALLSGCSFSIGTPTVSAADLQNDISSRLEKAGEKPQSVTCKDDLKGEVGQTTRCEVVLSATNAFEPIVAVTKVDGSTVSYEMTPALSQEQLQKQVGDLVSTQNGIEVENVTCESGLEGKKDNTAKCTLESGGDKLDAVVTVTKVDGLMMNFSVDEA